jgi:hypothetical protein
MEAHLTSYIEKIQRQHSDFLPPEANILPHHNLLEFMLLGENTQAPAFDFYHIQIQLVQQVNPSRLFFIAQLMGDNNHFPSLRYCHNPTNNPKQLKTILLGWYYYRLKNHTTTTTTPGLITIRAVLVNLGS